MGSVQRTKADVVGDFRRGQILTAARTTFARHGLTRTTVDQIARAARVAKGTVYLYFPSKTHILAQLLDEDLADLQNQSVPIIASPGTVQERLERFLTGVLGFFDRHRDFIEQCHFGLTPDLRRQAKQKLGQVFAAQAQAWQLVLADDALAPTTANPADVARGIVSLAHGLAIQRLRGWITSPLETDVAWAAALLAKGVRS